MNAQTTSIFGSIILAAAAAIAGYLAKSGIVPAGQLDATTATIGVVLTGIVTAAVTWYKAHQASDKVMIQTINANDNGVKVVPATAPANQVNAPIPEIKK